MSNDNENLPELPQAVEKAMRDYNTPPALKPADFDAMWSAIEAKSFKSDIGGRVTDRDTKVRTLTRHWFAPKTLLQIAATLIIGVAIGRFTKATPNASSEAVVTSRMTLDTKTIPEPYGSTTTRYLGQAAALLVDLPADARDGRADARLTNRAHDLLLTTRLLLDSPASDDTRVRGLLEDMELVLAQVVRLQSGGSRGKADLEMIRQAVDQRDVLPRLRTAVADIAAGGNE